MGARCQLVALACAAALLLLNAPLYAAVVVYEGTSFPEQEGWEPDPYCDPGRWIDGGWFFQHVGPCDGMPGPGGQQESFTRTLGDFIGEEQFFIEWRMETDGDRSEIAGVAPASVVGGGSFGVSYHFTVASDQVRFIQDNFLPVVWVDIEPDIPHTYRLELYGDELFVWYIDHDVAASGLPEGSFPLKGSVLQWRAKFWYLENTTKWDYIRYGTIPIDASGDYDTNETIDLFDFYFFHECLSSDGPESDAGPGCRFADFDFDTDVDLSDFAAFQNAFTGAN